MVLILLDLYGNAGDVIIDFPSEIFRGEEKYYEITRHHTSSPAASSLSPLTSRSAGCVASSVSEAVVPGVYSRQELRRGQMHAHAPPHGLCAYRILPISQQRGQPTARAHMLSSLQRLGRRPAEHAIHNDAAAVLQRCACAGIVDGGAGWRELWYLSLIHI